MSQTKTSDKPQTRTIKHGLFTYWEPTDTIDQNGEPTTRYVERMAFHNQTVEIPRAQDVARGEEHGAFWTDEELKARSASAAAPAESEESTGEVALSDLDDDELVDYLMSTGEFDGNKKPTVSDVSEAVGDDPELARRVLEAEDTATGGNPRAGLVEKLEAVSSNEDEGE